MTTPRLSIWVTSTGRDCAIQCVQETVKQCAGLDYRMLIFESQPDNPHNTVDVFKGLDCDKKVWTGDYPPLGWIYNMFMEYSGDYFLRLDDDCWPVCNPTEMIHEAIELLKAQPVAGSVISNVPLEMNPRMALDIKTGQSPEGANQIPQFAGWYNGGVFGPLGMVKHPGSLPVVDKRFIMPWNETCHWRQVELYHIFDGERRGLLSAYMLKWWGCLGHFSPAGVDGVSRETNLAKYIAYRDKGYYGRRPKSTWAKAFLGTDLPEAKNDIVEGEA